MSSEMRLVGQIYEIPRSQIRPFPNQPRRYFDQEELTSLAESIRAHGQLVPGEVREIPDGQRHRFELVDGQRRWHATGIAGLTVFRASIVQVQDERTQFLRSVGANFGRAEHTELEIAEAINRLRRGFEQKMTLDEVARVFGKSVGWVQMYESLIDLDDQIKPLLEATQPRDKRLRLTDARLLSRLPRAEQLRFVEQVLRDHRLTKQQKRVKLQDAAAKVMTERDASPSPPDTDSETRAVKTVRRRRGQVAHDRFRQLASLVKRSAEALEAQQERDFGTLLRGRSSTDLADLRLFCRIAVDVLSKIETAVNQALPPPSQGS